MQTPPSEKPVDPHPSSTQETGENIPPGSILLNLAVSAGVIAASIWGFFLLGERDAPQRKKPPKSAGVAVKTVPVEAHNGPVTIDANGVVVPFREIRIASEVRGRVIEQSENLRAGRRVKAGETLLRIDPTDYRIEVSRLERLKDQAQAELDALEITVGNTQQVLTLARKELDLQQAEMERLETLRERGVSSQSDTEAAKRAELVAQQAVVRIENQLRDAGAQRKLLEERLKLTDVELDRARLNEQRTVITSPFDALVIESMVEEQSFLQAGQSFATLDDTTAMEVRCNLTLDEMYWIWNDASLTSAADTNDSGSPQLRAIPARVRFSLGQREFEWQAEFARVDGAGIDERTRTVPCLFRVSAPNEFQRLGAMSQADFGDGPASLMRGMFVSVHIESIPPRDLFRVPDEAVRPGKKVWLAENGKLKIVGVDIVSRVDGQTVTDSEDLEAGQNVIVTPVSNARPGLAVMLPGEGGNRGGRGGGPGGGRGGGPGARSGGSANPGARNDSRPAAVGDKKDDRRASMRTTVPPTEAQS